MAVNGGDPLPSFALDGDQRPNHLERRRVVEYLGVVEHQGDTAVATVMQVIQEPAMVVGREISTVPISIS